VAAATLDITTGNGRILATTHAAGAGAVAAATLDLTTGNGYLTTGNRRLSLATTHAATRRAGAAAATLNLTTGNGSLTAGNRRLGLATTHLAVVLAAASLDLTTRNLSRLITTRDLRRGRIATPHLAVAALATGSGHPLQAPRHPTEPLGLIRRGTALNGATTDTAAAATLDFTATHATGACTEHACSGVDDLTGNGERR
jgi:hypothetical protein